MMDDISNKKVKLKPVNKKERKKIEIKKSDKEKMADDLLDTFKKGMDKMSNIRYSSDEDEDEEQDFSD